MLASGIPVLLGEAGRPSDSEDDVCLSRCTASFCMSPPVVSSSTGLVTIE